MSVIDLALMDQLDAQLGQLCDNDKALFFETLQAAAAAASRSESVGPEAITDLEAACQDWPAMQAVLLSFQALTAGMV